MTEPIDAPEEITPAWLAGVLGAAGLDVAVRSVEVARVGTGQIGANYRVTPAYSSAPDDVPASFVVKLAAGDTSSRQRVAEGYRKEVGFYREIAGTVAIDTPRCWFAAITDDAMVCTLVLDDLAPAVPGVQADGCALDAARAALVNLAGLHGPRWRDESLLHIGFLTPATEEMAGFLAEVFRSANEQFADRYRDRLGDDDRATLRDVAEVIGPWQLARSGPFAVVHGDYRLDNLMFSPSGRVTALDWQTVTVAPAARDAAYFLGTCLEPELRRAHERELFGGYLDALAAHGVEGYGGDDAFDDYRLGQLQGPMITVLGCIYATATPSAASDGMFLAMITRSCAAIRDLKSLDLL